MPRQHDLGGQPGGPLDIGEEHDAPPFGKMFTGILAALRQHNLVTIDEMRRSMEDLPEHLYNLSYFERWGEGLCVLLAEKGVLSVAKIEARMNKLKAEYERESGT